MFFITADIFSGFMSNAASFGILYSIIGLAVFVLFINFLYNVPKQLKRIADSMEKGKVEKKKGDLSDRDDISMYVNK